jgi:putative transcriptional regulator
MEQKLRIHLGKIMGERKLNQKDLAEMTGLDAHTISDWYYEKIASMSIKTLLAICKALEITDMNQLLEIVPDEQVNEE